MADRFSIKDYSLIGGTDASLINEAGLGPAGGQVLWIYDKIRRILRPAIASDEGALLTKLVRDEEEESIQPIIIWDAKAVTPGTFVVRQALLPGQPYLLVLALISTGSPPGLKTLDIEEIDAKTGGGNWINSCLLLQSSVATARILTFTGVIRLTWNDTANVPSDFQVLLYPLQQNAVPMPITRKTIGSVTNTGTVPFSWFFNVSSECKRLMIGLTSNDTNRSRDVSLRLLASFGGTYIPIMHSTNVAFNSFVPLMIENPPYFLQLQEVLTGTWTTGARAIRVEAQYA